MHRQSVSVCTEKSQVFHCSHTFWAISSLSRELERTLPYRKDGNWLFWDRWRQVYLKVRFWVSGIRSSLNSKLGVSWWDVGWKEYSPALKVVETPSLVKDWGSERLEWKSKVVWSCCLWPSQTKSRRTSPDILWENKQANKNHKKLQKTEHIQRKAGP